MHSWSVAASSLLRAAALALLGLLGEAAAAQTQRVYIAPDDHTDYMWTADEDTYRKALLDMTEFYLDLADTTAHNPSAAQSRWNMDASLWMWTWEQNRSPAQVQRLVERIRDGHFSLPLNFAVSTYGGMPTEAVLRSMYYSGSVERRYGLHLPLAIAMENQTVPNGLAALWAGSGARYSWRGVCACATKLTPAILEPRSHEIYWMQAPDGSRVLMKWYSTLREWRKWDDYAPGGYGEARRPAEGEGVSVLDATKSFTSRYPYNVYGFFGEGEDALATMNDSFIRAAQKLTKPGRDVIVSNEEDFFRDFEAHYGKKLPVERTSFGNDWDTYSASMQEVTSSVRRATERLRSAEAMETLVALRRPDFPKQFRGARDAAWVAYGLYWEHDWTADGKAVSRQARADWQRRTAEGVTSYVDELYSRSREALGGLIAGGNGGEERFFVFNPLGWMRSDVADLPYTGSEAVHVVDLRTGRTVPSQFVEVRDDTGTPQRRLRIKASDLPAVGYRVYAVQPGAGGPLAGGPMASGNVLESDRYRVRVGSNGAIESIRSKTLGGRELVRAAMGAAERRFANDLGPGDGVLRVIDAGPVSATIEVTVKATAPGGVPHTTWVTLYRGLDRISIRNEITANFAGVQTWAFNFNLRQPDVWHEELGAVLHARVEPEGDYAARQSKLDWLTLNHFVTMKGVDRTSITLSNADDSFFRLGNSRIEGGVSHLDTDTPRISVLAGGQVDGSALGIPKQGGDSFFLQRFALRAGREFDATTAMRFSMEDQNPPVAGRVLGGGTEYPEATFSLLTVSDPDALVWAIKPAEEGIHEGAVTRLWNTGRRALTPEVRVQGGLSSAQAVTHLETDPQMLPLRSGAVRLKLRAGQMRSFVWKSAARNRSSK